MLNTETNTLAMERRIRSAARHAGLGCRLSADYEHGQWWITNLDNGGQWSVCDADGSAAQGVFDGFCFEEITAQDGG